MAPEEGGRLPAGGTFLKGLDLGQTKASSLGVGDELQSLQRADVVTSAAGHTSRRWQESDLFVVTQSRWADPSFAGDRCESQFSHFFSFTLTWLQHAASAQSFLSTTPQTH